MNAPIKVTKHWRISRILKDIPDSVELFLEYDLDCFSCSASDTERLNDGLSSHGYSESDINEFVSRLQSMLDQKQQLDHKPVAQADLTSRTDSGGSILVAGLKFTPTAIQAITELNEHTHKYFQIKVLAGGCMGYSYEYNYIDSTQAESSQDAPSPTQDGLTTFVLTDTLKLVLDLYSYHKLHGSIVDYKFALKDSGLKITNPNTQSTCHCGKSVGF